MLARRFCVFNAGLKVEAAQDILTVIMTSNDKNVRSCKRHTVVRRTFCFWQSLCPFLDLRLTTVSLDNKAVLPPCILIIIIIIKIVSKKIKKNKYLKN